MTQAQDDFPAGIDQTTTQGQSWVAAADFGDMDPSDVNGTSNILPPTNFDYYFPGNWMVRAIGGPSY